MLTNALKSIAANEIGNSWDTNKISCLILFQRLLSPLIGEVYNHKYFVVHHIECADEPQNNCKYCMPIGQHSAPFDLFFVFVISFLLYFVIIS